MSETRVVVLEDERIVASHLKQQLSKLGYNVVATAASGEDALAQVRRLHPDVVLMDIHTAGPIDGIETAAQIASEIQIPVIYVTAHSDDATLERARQTKPYGFLVKPFSELELDATIQIALERRRLDAALQSSEMQVKRERDIAQRYLDVAGVIILVLDAEGKVSLINQRGVDILQYRDPKEIIGKPWIDSFIPDRLRDEMRQAHRSLIGSEAASVEFYVNPVLTKNGEERIIEWHNAILTDEHGRLSGSLSSGEDITERQRAMDALRLSEERFRSIFSAVSEGILIVDAKTGTFIDVNDPGATMFGYGPGELHGRDIETLSAGITPWTQREAAAWIQKAANSGQPQRFEWHCKARDGGLFWADVAVQSASIGNQDVVLAVVRDTTERRAIEAQLRQAQKMEAIGNLTGGIAHDFNNLLGIIIGNLDLLRDLVNSREIEELARDALEAGLRGADLTRRLLAFARRQPLQPQRIEVNDLVANFTKLLSRTLGEDIEISVDPARDLWPVVADPAQLEAAITNLATNARDAMPKGGRLKIATRNTRLHEGRAVHAEVAPGDYIVIEISDTGTGIEPASLDRIFEPFFTTKEIGRGTGLGLSMVFGFIRQSGGYVTVDSKLGAGTTFRLCLPRTVESASASEPKTEEPSRGGAETIMVVEDNPALRRIIVKQLAEIGYRVNPAENAVAALAAFDVAQDIDLLLTDVVMPGGVDGTELAQKLRARRPKLKVLLTSGFAAARVGETSRELNCPLLSKPYRKTELARAVREVLDA